MTFESEQGDHTGSRGWNRLALILIGTGAGAIVASAVLITLVLLGVIGDGGRSLPETVSGFGDLDEFTPPPSPTLAPTQTPPSDAPVDRILIPRFDVNAPVVVRGIANGVMESPDGPKDVAWYDFSAHPGFGSNAVFSGHVDWYTGELGVFWHLKDLEQDDTVLVRLADGTQYEYKVSVKRQVAATEDVSKIVGPTNHEVVTLITCGGTFNSGTGQYDQRLIVRAQRVYEEEPGQPSAGVPGGP